MSDWVPIEGGGEYHAPTLKAAGTFHLILRMPNAEHLQDGDKHHVEFRTGAGSSRGRIARNFPSKAHAERWVAAHPQLETSRLAPPSEPEAEQEEDKSMTPAEAKEIMKTRMAMYHGWGTPPPSGKDHVQVATEYARTELGHPKAEHVRHMRTNTPMGEKESLHLMRDGKDRHWAMHIVNGQVEQDSLHPSDFFHNVGEKMPKGMKVAPGTGPARQSAMEKAVSQGFKAPKTKSTMSPLPKTPKDPALPAAGSSSKLFKPSPKPMSAVTAKEIMKARMQRTGATKSLNIKEHRRMARWHAEQAQRRDRAGDARGRQAHEAASEAHHRAADLHAGVYQFARFGEADRISNYAWGESQKLQQGKPLKSVDDKEIMKARLEKVGRRELANARVHEEIAEMHEAKASEHKKALTQVGLHAGSAYGPGSPRELHNTAINAHKSAARANWQAAYHARQGPSADYDKHMGKAQQLTELAHVASDKVWRRS